MSASSDRAGQLRAVREGFLETVGLHLESDVPASLLLSSGVDSVAIAVGASELGADLTCVTIQLPGTADESGAAGSVAERLGFRHEVLPAVLSADAIPQYFAAMQRPTIDGLNTFIISRSIASMGFKVALSGLGGDEAMGGYPHFRAARMVRLMRVLSQLDRYPAAYGPIRRIAAPILGSEATSGIRGSLKSAVLSPQGPRNQREISRYAHQVFPMPVLEALGLTEALVNEAMPNISGEESANGGPFIRLSGAEVDYYLRTTLLPDSDGFSMAHSLELRVPFADWQLFTMLAAMTSGPARGRGKRLLADALDHEVLDEVVAMPKRGFGLPYRTWLEPTGPLRPYLNELRSDHAPIWKYINRSAGRALMSGLSSRGRWTEPWTLAALNAWLESVEAS